MEKLKSFMVKTIEYEQKTTKKTYLVKAESRDIARASLPCNHIEPTHTSINHNIDNKEKVTFCEELMEESNDNN
jgi:hypothetical protein